MTKKELTSHIVQHKMELRKETQLEEIYCDLLRRLRREKKIMEVQSPRFNRDLPENM